MNVVMAAAECRGLVKVGGLGDVVADLGRSLTAQGERVRVIIPFYDQTSPSGLDSARSRGTFNVSFEGRGHLVHHYVAFLGILEVHLLRAVYFTGDYGTVYVDSHRRNRGPFEDDARRFAFFSTAVHTLLTQDPAWKDVEVVHAHDWHTGALVWLLDQERPKSPIRTVFTIHNMDYQGVRPLYGGLGEGVRTWWPELVRRHDPSLWDKGMDPRYSGCFNLLRAGITSADALTTVSPRYAGEILLPEDPSRYFAGGRGLESDIRTQEQRGVFHGWLNGIDYDSQDPASLVPAIDPEDPLPGKSAHKAALSGGWEQLIRDSDLPDWELLAAKVGREAENGPNIPGHGGRCLAVMITRVTPQKTALLLEEYKGRKVWEHLLDRNLDLVVLGTGDQEQELLPLRDHPRGHFLRTFNPALSRRLYAAADLFLMPSDFEPCGLSQLLALRYGSLPVVSNRGGLADTVDDGVTGFVFSGDTRIAQVEAFLEAVDRGIAAAADPVGQKVLVQAAMARRFTWDKTTEEYISLFRRLQSG